MEYNVQYQGYNYSVSSTTWWNAKGGSNSGLVVIVFF